MKSEKIVIDIDGVLIPESSTGPFDKYLTKIDNLTKDYLYAISYNYTIIFMTARGHSEYFLLKKWLDDNLGSIYEQLICGKINAKYVIDDRSFTSLEEFHQKVMRK